MWTHSEFVAFLLCNYVILCIIDSLPYQSVQMVVHDKPGMNESYKLVCRVNYPVDTSL